MAGSLGTVHGLIFGLVVVGAGVAALAPASNAESAGKRIAQGAPSVFFPPVKPAPQAQPARAGSPAQEAPTPEQIKAIAHVQTCLAELGYYKGAVDGKRGRETWTAYWNFKHDHGLGAYSDLLAEKVREKLDELCIETAAIEPPPAQPVEPAADDITPQAEPSSEVESVKDEGPRLDLDCLPDELISLLRRAHGGGVAVQRCAPACLPPPSGLSQSQLDEMQAKNGVAWCRTCVPIDGHLALDDVRRIERAGNLELCATPPLQLQRYGSGAGDPLKAYTRIRELYRALPAAEEDPEAVAVIIGNRNYASLPASETSQNDASAIYAFLSEHLGYRPDNIIDVRDATKASLEKLFGAEPGLDGELARLVESQPNAKVLVYYSGHGATDAAQTETYLLPVDVETYREEIGGYKLSTLYANLARLNAKSVLVLLETDYGRDHGPSGAAAQPARDDQHRAAAGAGAGADGARRVGPWPAHADRRDVRYRPVHPLCDRGTRRQRRPAADRQWRRRTRQRRDLCLHRRLCRSLGAQDVRHAPASGLFQRRRQRARQRARGARSARVEFGARLAVSRTAQSLGSRWRQNVGGATQKRFTLPPGFLTGRTGS